MRILLINPPYPMSECPTIPIGLGYVAAVLEKNRHEVRILDYLVSRYSEESLARCMAEFKPQAVGVTSVTMTYPASSKMLNACKEIDPDIVTVIGGPHVTFCVEETLREAPWIDILVRGEGEYTMLDIANGKKLSEIQGIAFREDGKTVITEDRPWIENLDELPLPARHLFPVSKYRAFSGRCSLISARGCPFNCIFCVGHRMVGRKPRLRSPKAVVDEIQSMMDLGFGAVVFDDDLLTMNHKHLNEVCNEIINRNLQVPWGAFSRVDTINREILTKMKQAGCTGLLFGMESGNQEILDRARKKITLEKAREAVALTKEVGLGCLCSFIAGLPGETPQTLMQTYKFAKEFGVPWGFHVVAPFPGTELREKAAEYEITILTNDWAKYDANRAVCRTKDVGPQEIAEILRKYFGDIKGYITYREIQAKEGKLSETEIKQERMERQQRFVWHLLKTEVIENLGPVAVADNPVSDLAVILAKNDSQPSTQIEEHVSRLMDEGLLVPDRAENQILWHWA